MTYTSNIEVYDIHHLFYSKEKEAYLGSAIYKTDEGKLITVTGVCDEDAYPGVLKSMPHTYSKQDYIGLYKCCFVQSTPTSKYDNVIQSFANHRVGGFFTEK